MFAKARVIQRMGHTYRRHDHFDPWFSIIKFLCKYHSKVFRKHVPINMEWIEFIVRIFYFIVYHIDLLV